MSLWVCPKCGTLSGPSPEPCLKCNSPVEYVEIGHAPAADMRDPDRIAWMLELIGEAWEITPDWRLCQLLHNYLGINGDLFNIEDDVLEKALVKGLADQDEASDWVQALQ